MKSVFAFAILLFGISHAQIPCKVGDRDSGTWDSTITREGLRKGKGNYWSLSCKTDSSNWIQLVEWSAKMKSPKVLLTFRSGSFYCEQDEFYSHCNIITDNEIYPGKQPLTFTYYGGHYTCREAHAKDPEGYCINAGLMIPDSSFKKQAKACLKQATMCKGKNGK